MNLSSSDNKEKKQLLILEFSPTARILQVLNWSWRKLFDIAMLDDQSLCFNPFESYMSSNGLSYRSIMPLDIKYTSLQKNFLINQDQNVNSYTRWTEKKLMLLNFNRVFLVNWERFSFKYQNVNLDFSATERILHVLIQLFDIGVLVDQPLFIDTMNPICH